MLPVDQRGVPSMGGWTSLLPSRLCSSAPAPHPALCPRASKPEMWLCGRLGESQPGSPETAASSRASVSDLPAMCSFLACDETATRLLICILRCGVRRCWSDLGTASVLVITMTLEQMSRKTILILALYFQLLVESLFSAQRYE